MGNTKVKQLWFGDERGYNATVACYLYSSRWLWFGDERGYNATSTTAGNETSSCGLVMKEDITQRCRIYSELRQVVVW